MKKDFWIVLVTMLAYSLTAFAYMHATFPTKDVFNMILERLSVIEHKIDICRGE